MTQLERPLGPVICLIERVHVWVHTFTMGAISSYGPLVSASSTYLQPSQRS